MQNMINAQISNFESFRIPQEKESKEAEKLEELRKQAEAIKREMTAETTTEEFTEEEITTSDSLISSTETDMDRTESVLEGSEGDDVLIEKDGETPN